MKYFLGTLLVLAMTACGSVPFFKGDTEDLNALTYGKNERKSWSPQRIAVQPEDFNSETRYGRSIASEFQGSGYVAGVENTANNFSNDVRATGRELDPTNEQTRQQIEVARKRAAEQGQRLGRSTKRDLWDNAPADGSLWSGEGDVNFFFTRSKIRNMGDIVNIKMQEPLVKQIASEVKRNLTPAEQQVELAIATKGKIAAANADSAKRGLASVTEDELKGGDVTDAYNSMSKAVQWSQVDLSTEIGIKNDEEIRAEVIDRYPNGNYKVRAVKQISYRGRPRVVSLVGVAAANDFDEQDTIQSGKLYEYQVRMAR